MDSYGERLHMSVSGTYSRALTEMHVHTDTLPDLGSMLLINLTLTSQVNFAICFSSWSVDKSLAHAAVGHNLGGAHPFYDEEIVKQGQIGGLMDYGLYKQ